MTYNIPSQNIYLYFWITLYVCCQNLERNLLTFIEMRYSCDILVCTQDNRLVPLCHQLLSEPACYIVPDFLETHFSNSESPSGVLPILVLFKFHFRTANLPLTLNYTPLVMYPALLCYPRPCRFNWTFLRCFKPVIVMLKRMKWTWCTDFPNKIFFNLLLQ
jgi:hypothetical protein